MITRCLERLGAIAQLVEHLHGMQGVSGSNPLGSIFKVEQRMDMDATNCLNNFFAYMFIIERIFRN